MTLNIIGDPSSGVYTVEEIPTNPNILGVDFFVDGVHVREERKSRYLLFGGDTPTGAFLSRLPSDGTHIIKADVWSAMGVFAYSESITIVQSSAGTPPPPPPPPTQLGGLDQYLPLLALAFAGYYLFAGKKKRTR